MTEFNKTVFKTWGEGSLDTLDELAVSGTAEEKFLELSERDRELLVTQAIDRHNEPSEAFEAIDEVFESEVSDQKDNFVFDTQAGIWQGVTTDRDDDGNVEKVAFASFSPY